MNRARAARASRTDRDNAAMARPSRNKKMGERSWPPRLNNRARSKARPTRPTRKTGRTSWSSSFANCDGSAWTTRLRSFGRGGLGGTRVGEGLLRCRAKRTDGRTDDTILKREIPEESRRQGRDIMVAIEAIATLAVVWALVLWGSIYFNRNVV